jgi:hypothetical protein
MGARGLIPDNNDPKINHVGPTGSKTFAWLVLTEALANALYPATGKLVA